MNSRNSGFGDTDDRDFDEEELLLQENRRPSKSRTSPRRRRSGNSNTTNFINSLTRAYTSTEKMLVIVVIILMLLVFAFGSLYSSTLRGPTKDTDSVCTTPDCVLTAARVISSLDTNVDACEDFYQFTCGGWMKKNPIPEDKSLIGTFTILSDENLQVLKSIFDQPYQPDSTLTGDDLKFDQEIFTKSQSFYKSCLNETQIEVDGITALTTLTDTLTNGFPLGDADGKIDMKKFVKVITDVFQIGSSPIMNAFVDADNKNPDVNMIQVEQSGISLPSRDYYVKNLDVVAVLKEVVEEIFAVVGPSVEKLKGRDWKAVAGDVVDVETKVAAIFMDPEELENPSVRYNPMKISSLSTLVPSIDWLSYFSTLFPKAEYPNVVLPDTIVIVNTVEYLKKLSDVLSDISPSAMENYIVWHIIGGFAKHTTKQLRIIKKKLDEKIGTAAPNEPPRWKTCLGRMDSVIGDAAGKWFIKSQFSGDSKKAAERSIDAIKEAMVKRVPQIDWIDSPTGKLAIEKIKSLQPKIGFPDNILSPKKMHEKYSSLTVDETKYFSNIISASRYGITRNLQDILIPVDKTRWGMTPPTVNAYYNPPLNEIAFPAGILQPPFYSAVAPQYLNFGAIGAVVGHEITHAFDNNGRQFDSSGRMVDWWSNKTAEKFDEKAKCFVDQYGKYEVVGPDGTKVNVNGQLTLGENLADNGGLSRAYEAWLLDLKASGPNSRNFWLPGLHQFSREQLFFVGFGQVWCQAILPSAALRRVRTDPHSPNRLRVNGAVQNSQYFRDAFRCREGKPMSPKDRCEIW
ncbi:Endothelin-converting enzyme 1 [Nowakowskiella sp. JEL0407]|nr:Endothelin-converting enzyme 1 [Nowakowskiella sp. JEL0407]